MCFVNVGGDPQLLITYVFVHLFFQRLVSLQQLLPHANNARATHVGVLPTQLKHVFRGIHVTRTN